MAKVVQKGKKKRKPRKPSERWKKYKVSGEHVERSAKFCPRCGPGVFLANMNDRIFCGRCHYTEFKGKTETKVEHREKKRA
ncbi:MAG: 30S ribosomal protein S27ae [Candidatus Pacearchaeota archaeon]